MRDQTCSSLRAILIGPRHLMVKGLSGKRVGLMGAILLAAAFLFWPSQGRESGIEADGEEISVLVAGRYLPAFTSLKKEAITQRTVPKNMVPPGALQTLAELKDSHDRAAYLTAVPIPAGQILNRAILLERERSHGLSSLLEPGNAAMAVSVDATHGAGGWVEPGDTIALFVTPLPTPFHPQAKTRLLFPMIRVLAVDQKRLGGGAPPSVNAADADLAALNTPDTRTLTLLLNPIQIQALIEAREAGPLTVVLRGLEDDQPWIL